MSNIIRVRLEGGLGNQLFQYAAGRAVALAKAARVELDQSWFGTDPNRHYALAPFAIAATIQKQASHRKKHRWLPKFLHRKAVPPSIFKESSFRYDKSIYDVEMPVVLKGFFKSIEAQLKKDFIIRTQPNARAAMLLQEIRGADAICVHFRRGDYISDPASSAFHGVCPMEYYTAALNWITRDLTNPHCFVFSDEPEWVRSHFNPQLPMTIVDIHGPDEAHEDLRLMSACRHFVIANSSFSWWAAWLGSCEEKRVAAPKRWFQSNEHDTSDLLPNTWNTF